MRRVSGVVLTVAAFAAGCGGDDSAEPAKRAATETPARAAGPAAVKIEVGRGPGYATFAFGKVWVGNHQSDSVMGIDPATNEVTTTVEVPGEPTGMSSGFGSLWTFTPLGRPKIHRIDPQAGKVEAVIPVQTAAAGLHGPVKAAGAMWVAGEDRWLLRIDPRTNRARKVLRLPAVYVPCPGQLAAAGGALWMAWECGADRILRIDPRRGRITATVRVEDDFATWVTARGGQVWALTQGGKVLALDTKRARVAREGQVSDAGAGMSYGEGALWVRARASELVRVDPETLEATRTDELPAAGVPGGGLAVGGGAVWAANFAEGTVTRLEP